MKKTLFVSFAILCLVAVCVAAATAAQLKEKTYEHAALALAKQAELKTKQYSGTWDEILQVRIRDVNEITYNVAIAKWSACEAMTISDPNCPMTAKEFIAKTIAERLKEPVYQEKHRNGEFLKAVDEIVVDPNSYPPPEDPNYIEEVERLEDFRRACLDLVFASGGI